MSSSAFTPITPSLDGFDAAVGFTVQQHLFALGLTRTRLGDLLGVPGQSVSNRLRGKVRWTAGDLAVAAEAFGVTPADLFPTRGESGWVPAPYVPGTQKAPVPSGTEASGLVAGAGFEPATSGLRVQALEATLPAALDSFSEGAVRCTLPERQRRRQHRHRWPARPGRAARRHCITARTEAVAA